MTLTQLRHLIDLAQTLSFSVSASRLHITQPALSRSIKALESELGQLLFDRVGRGIEITAFGQQVLGHAQSLVDLAHELRQHSRDAQQALWGQVRVGMGSGPGALLATPLMLQLAQQSPKVRVQVSRGSTPLLVQALRERDLDALVIDIRALKPSPDLHVEAFPDMAAGFMCREGHPLTQLRQVKLSQLRQYPVASTPLSDEVARMLMERYGTPAHPDQLVTLRSDEISHLLEVVRQTDAVLLAVRAVAPDLVQLPMSPSLNATARYGIVTLVTRSASSLVNALRTLILSTLDLPAR
jgi:DNA-binding transcriptional LysR family regulator